MIHSIGSENFVPFGKFEMNFPKVENKPDDLAEVHLFTGNNGTGKTRILALLAAALGGSEALAKRVTEGTEFHITGNVTGGREVLAPFLINQNGAFYKGVDAGILAYLQHVPAFCYQGITYVTDSKIAVMSGISKPTRNQCLSFDRPSSHSEQLLQAIANLKIQVALDAVTPTLGEKPPSLLLATKLEKTLTEVTGAPFYFKIQAHPEAALTVNWAGVNMRFECLPDGLRSIIGWLADAVVMMDAWVSGRDDISKTEAIILLDDIECHLHPAWQRKVLPAFQRLFPKAQIFVTTHSPFIISSLSYGWIHQFQKGDNGIIKILPPANADDPILEDFAGLKEWDDADTERLLLEFCSQMELALRGDGNAKEQAMQLAEIICGQNADLRRQMSQNSGKKSIQPVASVQKN